MKITRFLRLASIVIGGIGLRNSTVRAAVPVPLQGAAPVALDKLRMKNPAVLPLAGTWKFQLTHGEITPEGFRSNTSGPVSASSSQSGHPPSDALDSLRVGERWCADGDEMPQWWMADLGQIETVQSLDVQWEFDNIGYRFKAEGSNDSKKW